MAMMQLYKTRTPALEIDRLSTTTVLSALLQNPVLTSQHREHMLMQQKQVFDMYGQRARAQRACKQLSTHNQQPPAATT